MLDERNGYKTHNSPSLYVGYILPYTNQVEEAHMRLKRICNRFLTLGVVFFVLTIVVLLIGSLIFSSFE